MSAVIETSRMGHPFIIPVFIPHAGCPHQCAFCNQTIITSEKHPQLTAAVVEERISDFLKYKKNSHGPTQISYYGGNFLGLNYETIRILLETAARFVSAGVVDGIRFSTRPDTVCSRTLGIIKNFPVKTIELGVQSMDDAVLHRSKRGHTCNDTQKAVSLLQKSDYEIGLQMMVGLPGEDASSAMNTARKLIDLGPDFVRIYPTLVLKNSLLETWYKNGRYQPLTLPEAVKTVKSLYLLFSQRQIPVVRMGLHASEELNDDQYVLAGPYHPAFGHLVHSELFYQMAEQLLNETHFPDGVATLHVHPRSVSKIRGLQNRNIRKLEKQFQLSIRIITDAALNEDRLGLLNIPARLSYHDLSF